MWPFTRKTPRYLRLYSNGEDFVIAMSLEQAMELCYREYTGQEWPDDPQEREKVLGPANTWGECVNDRMFRLYDDDRESIENKPVFAWLREQAYPHYFARTF